MKTIMIVEDEQRFRTLISDYLTDEGFSVLEAANGVVALEMLKISIPDLMIIDIMMPQKDGYQLLGSIRKFSRLPVIILTALSEDENQLKGYDLGADDYLTKPYSPKILVAKVKALLKRWEIHQAQTEELLECGDLSIDILSCTIFAHQAEIPLSPKEYELLLFMIRNKGHVLSRSRILESVWGYDYSGGERTVDIHITRLREKLKSTSVRIDTLRKLGYKLEAN